ncbi:MAG: hypothetical protein M3O06_09995, partial [Pseudomonadota bacterium]|nr:hypothetical protein [Pseudomonadota bacterium]
VPYGAWVVAPSLIGPYGPKGAPTKPVTYRAFAFTQLFNDGVSADSGDVWADITLGTHTYSPLVLSSGQSGTLTLTITPTPDQIGKTISGYVYVDTFSSVVNTGDEVVRFPYVYTVER